MTTTNPLSDQQALETQALQFRERLSKAGWERNVLAEYLREGGELKAAATYAYGETTFSAMTKVTANGHRRDVYTRVRLTAARLAQQPDLGWRLANELADWDNSDSWPTPTWAELAEPGT